jgi:hypothetical protein
MEVAKANSLLEGQCSTLQARCLKMKALLKAYSHAEENATKASPERGGEGEEGGAGKESARKEKKEKRGKKETKRKKEKPENKKEKKEKASRKDRLAAFHDKDKGRVTETQAAPPGTEMM